MFDWKSWIEKFKSEPGYNDAKDYGVVVSDLENPIYTVLGVHHLTPDENQGQHTIFLDVLCKPEQSGGSKRIMNAIVNWTWEGRVEPGLPDPVRIGKPENEIADLPMFGGMKINLWHPGGNGVNNLHTYHPDELDSQGNLGNSIGHHSFLVVFQEIGKPQPPTPPPPGTTLRGGISITVNQAWIASLRPDTDGNVTFHQNLEQ